MEARQTTPAPNAVEGYKATMDGDGLRILEHLPQIIERGPESLSAAEKELLNGLVFFTAGRRRASS